MSASIVCFVRFILFLSYSAYWPDRVPIYVLQSTLYLALILRDFFPPIIRSSAVGIPQRRNSFNQVCIEFRHISIQFLFIFIFVHLRPIVFFHFHIKKYGIFMSSLKRKKGKRISLHLHS